MTFTVAAKVVVLAHFAFVAFLFFGGLLFSVRPWIALIHGSCIFYAITISIFDWACPLTLLEKSLLSRGGSSVYSGEFLPHYVWSRFGLAESETVVVAGLMVLMLGVNAPRYRALLGASREGRTAA